MSQIKKLRAQLEGWKSHNEVHAKPADEKLYEVINGILDLLCNNEQSESPKPQEPPIASAESSDPPGGNNPEAPDVP